MDDEQSHVHVPEVGDAQTHRGPPRTCGYCLAGNERRRVSLITVRAWPSNVTMPPIDEAWQPDRLAAAISRARYLSAQGHLHYRTVLVMDDRQTVWAQFNQLWQAHVPAMEG